MDLIQQYDSASDSSDEEPIHPTPDKKPTNKPSPMKTIIKNNIDNLKTIDKVLGADLQIISIKKR